MKSAQFKEASGMGSVVRLESGGPFLAGCWRRAQGRGACTQTISLEAGAEIPLPRRDQERDRPTGCVYLVRTGCLETRRSLADAREAVTAFHLPGELLHLTLGRRGTIRHRAIEPSTLCRLRLDCGHDPALAERALASAVERIERDERHIQMLARKTSVERAADFLLDMNERLHGRDAFERGVSLPMGRAEVADYLGLQPESVSRALGALERRGVIRRDGWRHIAFPDPAGLLQSAGFV